MKYTDAFFMKLKKETDSLLHFLQECKFSGSWDTKIDLNVIIKLIVNYSFITNQLKKEIENLEKELKNFEKEDIKDA